MPRTRSQQRARKGLVSLDDDALRHVLSFLSVADTRCGPGVTSKAMREAVASNQLARARATAPYVLRGNTHGVVHSLATSFGTDQWHKRSCIDPLDEVQSMLSTPPDDLDIRIERLGKAAAHPRHDRGFRSSLVDPHADMIASSECCVLPGSFVEYKLPFQLRISHFRLGFGYCEAQFFKCFVFEAYDRDRLAWHTLYESNGVSPWEDFNHSGPGPDVKYFDVDAFTSTRFRIRLTDPRDAPRILGQRIDRQVPWKAMHAPSGLRTLRHRPPALAGLEPKLVYYLTLRVPRRPRSKHDALVRREPI